MESYLSLPEYVSADSIIQKYKLDNLNYIQNRIVPELLTLPNPIILVMVGLKAHNGHYMIMDASEMAAELNPNFDNFPHVCVIIRLTKKGKPIYGPLHCTHSLNKTKDIEAFCKVFNELLPNSLDWNKSPSSSIEIKY